MENNTFQYWWLCFDFGKLICSFTHAVAGPTTHAAVAVGDVGRRICIWL